MKTTSKTLSPLPRNGESCVTLDGGAMNTSNKNKSPLTGEEGLQRIALWQSVPDEGRRISYADGGQGFRGVFRGVFLFFLFTLLSTLTAGAQDIEYYDLWLGSTRVTSANKDNILNQVGTDGNPTAKFDPDEDILTLNEPTITGTSVSKIDSDLPSLTVTGSYHMTEVGEEEKFGIKFSGSTLTLNGDFTFGDFTFYSGSEYYYSAVSMNEEVESTLTLDGNIVLYGRVETGGNIIVNSGILAGPRIYCSKLIVNDGVDYVQYQDRSGTIELADGYIDDDDINYKLPNSTYIGGIIHKSDIDYYPVWLGNIVVTSQNKNNILNQVDANGNPTAKFDPDTHSLTLNNPTINGPYDINGFGSNYAKIYVNDIDFSISLEGSYHMSENDQASYGLYVYSCKITDGDFTFYGSTCGVCVEQSFHMGSGSLKAIGGDYGWNGYNFDYYGGSLDLEGGQQAINGEFIIRGDDRMVVMPEGGSIINNQFYEADGTTIAKHVIYKIYKYEIQRYLLWLGSTEVTSLNQDDIFGDGKASFDPSTNTLTLNNPTIPGIYTDWRYDSKIFALIDLTIKGSYHMTGVEANSGIVLEVRVMGNGTGSLRLDGDFTFYGNFEHAIEAKDITVKSGSLMAVSVGTAIWANSLTVEDKVSYVELQSVFYPLNLRDGNGLHLAEGYAITTPENGIFQNNVIYHSDGTTIAKSAVIQNTTNPILFYDLWVGSTHVNNRNQNDILGDGKASFNPTTNTLTLTDNPTIQGITKYSKIYSNLPSLTITGSYHMTEAEGRNGIFSEGGPLTLNGDFTILSKGEWFTDVDGITSLFPGITLWATGDITLNGNITVQGQDVYSAAIYTENGSITVLDGNLQASSTNKCAAWCGGTFTAKGSTKSITLEGNPAAIHAGNLVIDNADGQLLGYYEPNEADFDPIWKSVYSREGNIDVLATRVVLRQPRIYNLWLGSTQVTEDNCDDILGDRTASFDPESNTLTLNYPTISGTTNDCAIYADHMDLTVKGSANISTTASCAIKLMHGELTFNGNFTFEGNDYAIWFYPVMKLGQTIEITSPDDAVFMGENTVKYGNDVAKSVTMENVIRYKIWLGNTQVTGDNYDNILGDGKASFDPDTETLTLNNPTISGTMNDCAIYAEWMDLTVKGSANVTTAASCAIKLMYGELTFDGDFTFSGSDYAIWFNRTMKLGPTTEITSPDNVDFMGGNTVVLKSDYSTVAKNVTMRKVENKYKIWIGSTQVTSVNKDDIFGDGRASYNPDTQTLTLHDPTISGTYSVGKIFIKDYDLTIRGSYNMSAAEERIGLYASNCTLKLDGNFTFRGNIWGVASDRDITVKGNLNAIGGTSTGIHFDNENCVLTLEHGFMTSRVEMSGGQYAMSGGSVSTDATLLIPEGGRLNRLGFIRTANDEIAIEAILECRDANHGDGTEAIPYLIKSKEDWNLLAEDIEAGASTRGLYFALDADVKVTKMLGTEQNPFSGTFNGYGHTLTADINEENMQGAAPFHAISGATIKNLKVAGTVIGYSYNAGLVGYMKGNGNLIQDCEVSASIGALDGYNGGIVGHAGSYATTLEGCVFRGVFLIKVTSTTVQYKGTFVGWDETGAQLTLTRCLDLTQSAPIGRGLAEPVSSTNVYSLYDKSLITGNNAWTTTPQLAYKVTGADVSLTLTGTTGVAWDGNLYAAQGETLSFTVNRPGVAFTSTAGTFTQDHEACTLVMPAEDVTILNANASSFDIALNPVTNGTAVVKNASRAGAVVGIHITPNTYYLLDEVTVKDANNNDIEVEIDGEYGFFTMPNSDVIVSVTFKKQYSFENGVLHLLYGDFNIINRTAFDTDVLAHPENVTKVIADEGVRFTQSCSQLFKDFTGCTEMDLSNVNTAGLVTTSEMFSGCSSLQKLNLTGWETYQINYMNSMFEGCSNLREIDLSGFHVSEGTSMTRMFGTSGISKLTLPAGMAVTKEMELNKGRTYHNTYEGTWSNGQWSYSGWTVLGANGELVSTVEADDNSPNFTYAVIPAPPVAMTFVWKDMPDDFILELPDGQDNSKTIADWNGIRTSVQLTGRKLWKDGDWNTICLPFMLGPSEIISFFGNGTDFRGLDIYSRFNAKNELFEGEEGQNEDDFTYQTGFDEATGTLRLYFTPQNSLTHILPGEPYIIKWPNDTEHPYIENPTFTNVTIDISSDEANVSKTVTSEDGIVAFTGTYDNRRFTSTDKSVLFLGGNNTLYYPEAGASIGAFRAFFQLNGIAAGGGSNGIKSFILNFGDTTDSVGEMKNERLNNEKLDDAWYTLDGRKVINHQSSVINNKLPRGIYIHNGRKVVIK